MLVGSCRCFFGSSLSVNFRYLKIANGSACNEAEPGFFKELEEKLEMLISPLPHNRPDDWLSEDEADDVGQEDDGKEVVLSDPFSTQPLEEEEEEGEDEVDWGDGLDEVAEFQPILALQGRPKFMKQAHECLGRWNSIVSIFGSRAVKFFFYVDVVFPCSSL